jgi:hypothetical protein
MRASEQTPGLEREKLGLVTNTDLHSESKS